MLAVGANNECLGFRQPAIFLGSLFLGSHTSHRTSDQGSSWLRSWQAQMVGPLSAAGTMCERMHAVHRWCVTGERQCQCCQLCPLTSPVLPTVTSSRCLLHISRSSAEASNSAVSPPLFCPQARLWEHTATSWLTCTPCCTLCNTSPLAVGLHGVVYDPSLPHINRTTLNKSCPRQAQCQLAPPSPAPQRRLPGAG